MDEKLLARYIKYFLEENSKLNLISKNDEKFLYEKHIFDSLAISKFFDKYKIHNLTEKTLLDIGTGGGFPSVPLALEYPKLQVTALDSIKKKINAITELKNKLEIKNLFPICTRAENLNTPKYDFITSRAVARLTKLIPYAIPLLKKEGYFIVYKSIKALEEIEEAEKILKKYKATVTDIIEYTLPLRENHTRNLIIIKII